MKPKLLLLAWDYPFYTGTEAAFIEPELPALTEFFDVELAALLSRPCPERPEAEPNLAYFPAGMGSVAGGILGVLLDRYFYGDAIGAFRKARNLRAAARVFYQYFHAHRHASSLIRRYRSAPPALLYSFWGLEGAYALTLFKRRFPEIKCVTRFHGFDLYPDRTPFGYQPFRRAFRDRMDALYFISKQGLSYYEANFPADRSKMGLAFLGCPPTPVRAKPDFSKLVVVSCSRIAPVKRLPLFLESLALLRDIPVEWHHFGGGAELEALRDRARETCRGQKNLTAVLHGDVPNAALRPAYAELGARVFLNLSVSEGLPVSIMEAFSMGLPAVATDVGGTREIVSDATGLLLEANPTPEAVAAALRRIAMLSEADWQGLSERALKTYQTRFDSEKNAEAFAGRLKSLLSD